MISAATCALAGLNLSVEQLGMYTINMTANRGFICLSAINCGRKDPEKACVYALIFGFVRALQTIINNFVPAAISSLLTTRSAISFLVFTLLYTPCVAAIATIRRELDSRLKTVGVVLLQCTVAWIVACAAYAIAGLV